MDRDGYRDLIGGAAMVALGLFMLVYAAVRYDLGTPARMGPGMVPAGLGGILAALGAAIALTSAGRLGKLPTVDWWALGVVTASLVAFALTMRWFGLAPAIVVMVLIASRTDGSLGLFQAIALGIGLAAFSVLIFITALGLPLVAFRWP